MEKIYDVIIVGGGPAGITAGIYAARKKLQTLLLTKDFVGQAGRASFVDNYPGLEEVTGIQLMEKFRKHLEKFEIEIKEGEEATKIEKKSELFYVTANNRNQYLAKTIILTPGRDPRPLEVPGEKEFLGKGVSYCVTCDGPVFAGKTVAVAGAGNSGFMAALALSKYCPKVYILESGKKVMADESIQEKVKSVGNVEVMMDILIKEIKGKNLVESVVYLNQNTKKTIELPLEGIFIEIGSIPATSFVKGLVEFNKADEIVVNPKTGETSCPGIFAAGDADDIPYKQIIIAAGEGAKAALSAYDYLQKFNS